MSLRRMILVSGILAVGVFEPLAAQVAVKSLSGSNSERDATAGSIGLSAIEESQAAYILDRIDAHQSLFDFLECELSVEYVGFCDHDATGTLRWRRAGNRERVELDFSTDHCDGIPSQVLINDGTKEYTYFPKSQQGIVEPAQPFQLTLAPAPLDLFRPLSRKPLREVIRDGASVRLQQSDDDSDLVLIDIVFGNRAVSASVRKSLGYAFTAWSVADCGFEASVSYKMVDGQPVPVAGEFAFRHDGNRPRRAVRFETRRFEVAEVSDNQFLTPFTKNTLVSDYLGESQRIYEVINERGDTRDVEFSDDFSAVKPAGATFSTWGTPLVISLIAVTLAFRLLPKRRH